MATINSDSVARQKLSAFTDGAPEQVLKFAAEHEEAKPRWLYCRSVLRHRDQLTDRWSYDERGLASCERFLKISAKYKLRMLRNQTFEEVDDRLRRFGGKGLTVGPVEPWQVGHVYFARLASHPHVVKVGFSRRVADRLDDLQRIAGCPLNFWTAQPGIRALEAWWHRDWHRFRINGEWFFDPQSADRSLPAFLVAEKATA